MALDDDVIKNQSNVYTALYRGVTSNHNGDFFAWVVSIHIEQTTRLKDTRDCDKHHYCKVKMPNYDKNTKI